MDDETTLPPELAALKERLEGVPNLAAAELEEAYVDLLGRKQGKVTKYLKLVAGMPLEEKRVYGALANQLRTQFEDAFRARRLQLKSDALTGRAEDLTMPGRRRWVGAEHPVNRVVDEIVQIFREIGFAVAIEVGCRCGRRRQHQRD